MAISWTPLESPFDGTSSGGRFAYSAARGVIVGAGGVAGGQISTDGGATWETGTWPLVISDVAYSDDLDRFVAVGTDGAGNFAAYSDDGANTWTLIGNPWGGTPDQGLCVTRDDGEGLFVAGALCSSSAGSVLSYSTDGITWTAATADWDSGAPYRFVTGVCWIPFFGEWGAVGLTLVGGYTGLTSPDATSWSNRIGPDLGSVPGFGDVKVAPDGATVIATGNASGGGNAPIRLCTVNFDTWTDAGGSLTPGSGVGYALGVDAVNGRVVAVGSALDGGFAAIMESLDSGATWSADTSPFDGFGFAAGVLFDGADWFAAGANADGSVTLAGPSTAPPPDLPTPHGLKNTWRWVVTDLASEQKAFLDRLATNVGMDFILDDAAQMTCDLPSDDPDVYTITAGTDENPAAGPRVSFGNRLLYGLRREEPADGPPWKCRWAGLVTILQDQATADEPITHMTAHDPWMWARTLPVLNPEDGSLLGPDGYTYKNKTGIYIARDLIATAYAWIAATFLDPMPWNNQPNDGQHLPIDIDSGHFSGGGIPIDSINFAQGISVGEAWSQLCQTGTIDIILEPIFGANPGVCSILNVYNQAGHRRHGAVFGWDMFPRNLGAIDDLHDGTLIENVAQYWAGNKAAPVQTNDASVEAFGPYYVQKSYPAPTSTGAVGLLALAEVALRKKGKRTLLISPTPELAPDPFVSYYLGDQVPVWAGRPLPPSGNALRGGVRSASANLPNRVYGFHVDLADDLQETITDMLLTDPNSTE